MSGSLGDLVVSLSGNIAKFESAMTRAELLSKRTADSINDAMGRAEKAITGLAAGYLSFKSIEAFSDSIKGALDAAAALDDMAEKTGASVEALSALANAAKISGQDVGGLESGMTKLAKGIAATAETGKGATGALASLGISIKDAAGNLKDTGTLTQEIATAFSKYADGTGKAAMAQELFGKTGAQLLPFLKDLVKDGDAVSKVTAAQASEAEALQKTVKRLSVAHEDLARTIGIAALPVLQSLTDLMLKNATAAGGMLSASQKLSEDGSLATWATDGANAILYLYESIAVLTGNVAFVLRGIGNEIGGIGAQLAALARGDWSAFVAIGEEMKASAEVARKDFDAWESRVLKTRQAFAEQLKVNDLIAKANAGAFADQNDRRGAPALPKLNFVSHDEQIGKVTEYTKALEDANKRLAASFAEIQNPLSTLTGSEKKLAELRGSTVWATFTTNERINLRVTLEAAAAQERYAEAQKKARDGMAEMNRELAENNRQYQEFANKQDDANRTLFEKAAAIDAEIASYGKLPSEIEATTLALMRENLAMLENSGASEMLIQAKRDAIKAQEAFTNALNRREAFEQTISTINAMGDAVGNVARAFVNRVGSGIDYCRNLLRSFWADLVAMAGKKIFLNLVASVTGDAGVAELAAKTGANTALSAITNSVTIGKWLGLGGSLGTAAQGFGSGFMGGWSGGAAGAGGAEFVGPVMPGAAAGNSVGTFAAAAAPYAAAIAGIIATYSNFNKWGNDTTGKVGVLGGAGAGATLGFILGGPIGAGIGAAIGSWIGGSLFGRGKTNADAGGISGTVSGTSFSGSNWQDFSQRGGLFRSDNRWTETAKMSADQAKTFDTITENFRGIFQRIGGLLGSNADELLKGFTASFKIETKDSSAAEVQQKIQDFFDKLFRDQLGMVLAENGARLQVYVDKFTGSTDELADFAIALAGIATLIPKLNLKGLSFDSLDAMAKDGENIVDTFSRVAQGMANIQHLFDTKADSMTASLRVIGEAFSAIGEIPPQSEADWKRLANSIDLSTEAGRKLYDVMTQTGQSFAQVRAQISDMISGIIASASASLGGDFAKAFASQQLHSSINAWNAATSPGTTFEETFGAMAGMTLADLNAVIANTEANFGAAGVALLRQVWADYQGYIATLNSSAASTTTSATGFTSSVDAAAEAAARFAEQMAGARAGVATYLQGSLIADNSPLTNIQRYAEARAQYDANLAIAQSGTGQAQLDAVNNYQRFREALLHYSEVVNAHSGAYVADYFGTYDQGASLTAGAVHAYTSADGDILRNALVGALAANNQTAEQTTQTLEDLLTMFLNGNQAIPANQRQFMQDALIALQRIGNSSNAAFATTTI